MDVDTMKLDSHQRLLSHIVLFCILLIIQPAVLLCIFTALRRVEHGCYRWINTAASEY